MHGGRLLRCRLHCRRNFQFHRLRCTFFITTTVVIHLDGFGPESAEIEMLPQSTVFNKRFVTHFAFSHHPTQRLEHFQMLVHVPVGRDSLTAHIARVELNFLSAHFNLDGSEWRRGELGRASVKRVF